MKRRFFIRRFLRYLMLLMVPTILIFSFAMISFNYQLDRSLDARAKNTLSSVNNSLEMMVSNVAYQNEQLTNNAYTLIALKRLMKRETRIPYSDAIYLRNIKSTLSSIIRAYPYIQSVYLYLDGYNNYFSSDYGLEQLQPKGKVRKLDRTGYFHSWKPCPDRCCCCHRSFDRRTASENRK